MEGVRRHFSPLTLTQEEVSMSYEVIDAQYVLDHLGKVQVVDVRPEFLFDEGHIPGAVSVGLMKAQEADGDTADLFMEAFRAAGLDPDKESIVYCHSGQLAHEACDLLEAKGYTAQKCYEGSWVDWISDPARPVEK